METWKENYLTQEHKLILPEAEENPQADNKAYAAACLADFASIGFQTDKATADQLAKCSKEYIIAFHKEYLPVLKEMIGDGEYHPFYPNYPEGVKGLTELDYSIDQLIYCFTNVTLTPEMISKREEVFPFVGKVKPAHLLEAGSVKNYEETMYSLLQSQTAFSPAQMQSVKTFAEYARQTNQPSLLMAEMENKENKVFVLAIGQQRKLFPQSYLFSQLTHATDVLRYAYAASAIRQQKDLREIMDAVRLYPEETQKLKLSRVQRREMVNILERISGQDGKRLTIEMTNQKKLWKRVAGQFHAKTDFPWAKAVIEATDNICNNTSIDRPAKRIGEALKNKDYQTALSELKKRPGDFLRHFDQIYDGFKQTGILQGKVQEEAVRPVLNALEESAPDAGINPLLSLDAHIRTRNMPEESRTFYIPKKGKYYTREGLAKRPLGEEEISKIHKICVEAMVKRFSGKEPMGKVYLSPSMKTYAIPSNLRDISEATESYTPGSIIENHGESDIRRFFAHWTNLRDDGKVCSDPYEEEDRKENLRIDLDLSCTLVGENGKEYHIGWNDHRTNENGQELFYFSGDMQNGGDFDGEGVAEFVDLNRKALLEEGYQYAILSVNSFCRQPFIQQEHSSFGFMNRNSGDMGKAFEPATVQTKWKLRGKGTEEVAMAFDLAKDQYIWIDKQLHRNVASSDIDSQLQSILDFTAKQQARDLYTLAYTNARANGELVDTPEKADILFITPYERRQLEKEEISFEDKQVIYPYNLTYISSYLMADGNPPIEREERTRAKGENHRSPAPTLPLEMMHVNRDDDMER